MIFRGGAGQFFSEVGIVRSVWAAWVTCARQSARSVAPISVENHGGRRNLRSRLTFPPYIRNRRCR